MKYHFLVFETKFFTGIAILVLFLTSACSEKQTIMTAEALPNGQYVICESGTPVLQYNYQTVYERDVIRPESQKDMIIEYYHVDDIFHPFRSENGKDCRRQGSKSSGDS